MTRHVTALSCFLLLAACGENGNTSQVATPPPPPPQNVVTRGDIEDFCDAIPQETGDDAAATEARTRRQAEMLGANSEQVDAMNRGAIYARAASAFAGLRAATDSIYGGSVSPDDKKSFESICKAKVREQLFELTEASQE